MGSFIQAIKDEYRVSSTGPRFGGATASHSYATKVRWLVGAMLSIIALLSTALFLLLPAQLPAAPAPVPPDSPLQPVMKGFIVATRRIEVGQQIVDGMIDVQEISGGYFPEGAITATSRGLVLGRFATTLINAGHPLTELSLSADPPEDDIDIPSGFRAVTIPINEINSVAFLAKPDSRVDVMLASTKEGELNVTTIASTVKVLRVGIENSKDGRNPNARSATLLVTTDDAGKIELAKRMGEISLILAGSSEMPKVDTKPNTKTPPDIFGSRPKPEPRRDGRMAVTDPKTGRQLNYVLTDGRWTLETAE